MKTQKPSPFAAFHQKTLTDIPGYPGETAVIRKMNNTRRNRAVQAVHTKALRQVDAFGGLEMVKLAMGSEIGKAISPEVLAAAQAANEAKKAKVQADPFLAFDVETLVADGVVSWSFTDEAGAPVPVTPANIEELDDAVKDYVAREIYDLSDQGKAATKNASAPSLPN